MGRKSASKQPKSKTVQSADDPVVSSVKLTLDSLSPQKKNDINKIVDKLLKITVAGAVSDKKELRNNLMEMDKLLQKCRSIESEIDIGFPTRSQANLDELSNWMVANGAKIDGVEISSFDDYELGLKSKKDMTEGDFILSIPRKLMMTAEYAKTTELEYLIKNDPMLAHMPNIILALFVLLEKFRGNSFWAPYLNCLPRSYNTVMYFTMDELDELKGSPTYESAMKHCRNIARQYGYLRNLFHNSSDAASQVLRHHFTYEQYRWAVSTVMTRQNFIPASASDNPMILALIPYWDMGNHDNVNLTTDYNVDADQSEYYSCRDFTRGQQVFMSYGKRPNSELFLHNAFVHENNASDGVKLKLGVSKSDPLVNLRSQLLTNLCIPFSAEFLLPSQPRPFTPHGKFVAFLRIFCMGKDNLEKCLLNENNDDLMSVDVSHEIDLKVWQFLSTRINLLLAAYPSSLDEDEAFLKSAKIISPRLRLAVLQRVTEKRILVNTINDLKDLICRCSS